jgi:hypothetical protein
VQSTSEEAVPLAADSSFSSIPDKTAEGDVFRIPSYYQTTPPPPEEPKWSQEVPKGGWPITHYDKWTDMYRKYE